jgi:hypothetical protein
MPDTADVRECHYEKCRRSFTPAADGPTFHCSEECAERCLADRLARKALDDVPQLTTDDEEA